MATNGNTSDFDLPSSINETKQVKDPSISESASIAIMSSRSVELEGRYHQLLEQRIATLESLIALPQTDGDPDKNTERNSNDIAKQVRL